MLEEDADGIAVFVRRVEVVPFWGLVKIKLELSMEKEVVITLNTEVVAVLRVVGEDGM